MILLSTEEVRSGQRSKAFVLATTSVQLHKIGGRRIYNTDWRKIILIEEQSNQWSNLGTEVNWEIVAKPVIQHIQETTLYQQ